MQVGKVGLKTLYLAGALATATIATSSCSSTSENATTEQISKTKQQEQEEKAKIIAAREAAAARSQNVPIINGDTIKFYNTSGDFVTLVGNDVTKSLYQGVIESKRGMYKVRLNNENTYGHGIVDSKGFYAKVMSKIPQNKDNEIAIQLFNNLYDMHTTEVITNGYGSAENLTVTKNNPISRKGYTQMMEAWASTGEVVKK